MNFETAPTSGLLSDLPSTDLAESAHGLGGEATHDDIQVVSPGKEDDEEKNQDRLKLTGPADGSDPKCQFAIVCDGTTSSPYSAAAAEYVCDHVRALFQEDGLRQTAEALKDKRVALLAKPLKMDEGQPALLKSMFEQIVRQKYQDSYQTTFVAVCLKREETNSAGMISIKALACGDSALFIFREKGELRYNNVNLDNELDRFKHSSPFTAVLPDCYNPETNNVLFDFKEFPEDVHLLLCSDGFYDGFTNFREIREWLTEHRAKLEDSELRKECLLELHDNLNKKGDDDISFIWLRPKKSRVADEKQEAVEREEEETARAKNMKAENMKVENMKVENMKRGKLWALTKFFRIILSWFRFRTE